MTAWKLHSFGTSSDLGNKGLVFIFYGDFIAAWFNNAACKKERRCFISGLKEGRKGPGSEGTQSRDNSRKTIRNQMILLAAIGSEFV